MMPFFVWLHLLAAIAWIGGMVFLSAILMPVLRREGLSEARITVLNMSARRFRVLVWGAVAVLLTTGPLLLAYRGLSLIHPESWPAILAVKIALAVTAVLLTALHDLVLGPRVRALRQHPLRVNSGSQQILLKYAPWIPRMSLLVTLTVLWLAVIVARS